MATKRTQTKPKKPAAKAKTAKRPARPAPRRGQTSDASVSVVDGAMRPLIRAAFAKRLRG